jgi:hypothetical protein
MLLGLGRGPPGRGPPGRGASEGPPGPGRAGKRVPPGRGGPEGPGLGACWLVPAGPPGAPPPTGPGAPGWPGRAPRGADPIPVAVELNGLLPGRGRPGRGGPGVPEGGRADEPPGLGVLAGDAPGPGRGPADRGAPGVPVPGALAPGVLVSAAGGPAAAAGASGRPCGNGTGGRGGLGTSAGWPPAAVSAPGLVAGPGAGRGSAGAAGAAGTAGLLPLIPDRPSCPSRAATASAALGAAGADAGPPGADAAGTSPRVPTRACLGCWVANASLSLRTTGASIVEDAERTNSPISWSLAITALLSTPNSFASSYTRTFATALPLLGPARPDQSAGRGSACSVRRQPLLFIAACSSVAHRNLSLLSPGRVAPALRFVPPCSRPTRPHPSGHDPAGRCAANYPVVTDQDTRRARRSQAVPAVAVPARMPAGAALPRSIPGWDAGMRPGQAFAPADRERSRSRLPPGEASQTWPHGLRIPHRSGSLTRAGQAADTA